MTMENNNLKMYLLLKMVIFHKVGPLLLQMDICAMVKSRYIGDGHPTFNRNPYNGYINPYYWVDDHPLVYGNNGSLDPGTYSPCKWPYKWVTGAITLLIGAL